MRGQQNLKKKKKIKDCRCFSISKVGGRKGRINLSIFSNSELDFTKDTSELRVVVMNLSGNPFIQD